MGLLDGKKALIFGVANEKSIAYGITQQLIEHGAEVGLSYAGPALEKRVKPIAEKFGINFCEECDLGNGEAIVELFKKVEKHFGKIDILVHSVAYAPKEALNGRYVDTKREDFLLTFNISVYTLVAVAKHAEPLMNAEGSIITLTYYGGEKVVYNYNVMGVAKAALDSTVQYLANDLGPNKIRVNAISSGPIRTLAASGIGAFRSTFAAAGDLAPMGRAADIYDSGRLAVFLGSDLARNVTGEVIHVDAGFSIIGVHGMKEVTE